MGLTRNLQRTGAAAHNDKREISESIEYQNREATRKREEADRKAENILMLEMIDKYGDAFTDWYDSPAVPERGCAQDRITLIREWEAQQKSPTLLEGLTAPVVGYVQDNKVHWTTETTPTYRAVWDESPDSVTFVKQ